MKVRELRVTYVPRPEVFWDERKPLTSPKDAATLFREFLGQEPIEVFALACLNAKHRLLCYHEISRGTVDSAIAHPRDIFKAAILANAAAILVAHNHPSGDPTPSPDDARLTERLVSGAVLLGIPILDHVIVANDRYFSFREGGKL